MITALVVIVSGCVDYVAAVVPVRDNNYNVLHYVWSVLLCFAYLTGHYVAASGLFFF